MIFGRNLFFPGQYSQGPGILDRLPEIMAQHGNVPMALVTPSFSERIGGIMEKSDGGITETFQRECTHAEIRRVYNIAQKQGIDVLAGVGGGKTLDCVKVVADMLDIPVIIVPTIASTDAPCTAVSIIYNESGEVVDFLQQKKHPAVVLADSEVIFSAPVRYLVAGMGDALATGFEAESCRKKGVKSYSGGEITETGLALAGLATELVFSHGKKALQDCREKRITPVAEKVIEANILLSGLGFEYCHLASAHAIHNGLTRLECTGSYLHGEKVAFGVLAGLHLNNTASDELNRIYSFYSSVGLPVSLEQIGINEVSSGQLELIAATACMSGSPIYNEPVQISEEKVVKALKDADSLGKVYSV